ncbi:MULTISPECIES: alpha/beta hydrolase [unclassified Halanaerobium]|uniref:alpha/beta hydrolase n=1 Tax=unclassified Halanaerobium TaxID=2641197 RepID=UPI000DF38030|nr:MULTISPECIES: alpha/beta hydrolase [unclassified Halanaerobium]RCW48705.1 alpha-beta hydrolase superfamily lysophospholipase [Halanaerobium sp. MA284_MarDTE_T2]RCW86551.1 alpha-beta hydrolase superfamily lysophospholipase [Halanaerobium sp. DL-01]
MHSSEYIDTFDGKKLFTRKDIVDDAKAVVVFVHGLDEHQGRYDYHAGRFNGEGFSVYRFDNRGHGRSDGKQTYIDDFNTYLKDADTVVDIAKKENPDLPIFMLGHSMGGFITAAYGIKHPNKLNGQILSGSWTNTTDAFAEIQQLNLEENPDMKLPNELGNLISRSEYVIDDYEKDPYVSEFTTLKLMKEMLDNAIPWLVDNLKKYKYPVLVLHGGSDPIIDPSCSEKLYDMISSKDRELKIYPELYHEILNEPEKEEVIKDILLWLEYRC